jgi:hypothetical protein
MPGERASMMKFIRTPNALINPDHVAAVERDRHGKITIRFAIPDADGHYSLCVEDDSEYSVWMQFANRPLPKSGD